MYHRIQGFAFALQAYLSNSTNSQMKIRFKFKNGLLLCSGLILFTILKLSNMLRMALHKLKLIKKNFIIIILLFIDANSFALLTIIIIEFYEKIVMIKAINTKKHAD